MDFLYIPLKIHLLPPLKQTVQKKVANPQWRYLEYMCERKNPLEISFRYSCATICY